MTTTVQSSDKCCLQGVLPCWCSDIPKMEKPGDKVEGDWALVEVYKREKDGSFSTSVEKLEDQKEHVKKIYSDTRFFDPHFAVPKMTHTYCMEVSTGNLYNYIDGTAVWWGKEIPRYETKGRISFKCSMIFLATIPYIIGLMAVNLIRIVFDIYYISKAAIADFQNAIKNNKGIIAAAADTVMKLTWVIPSVVMHDIWRVVRCPFYGIGMLFSSFYGVFIPLEGRKWFSEIEDKLHKGAPALQHPYLMNSSKWTELKGYFDSLKDLYNRLSFEKALYLGWCMHKRGNIHENVNRLNRFEYVSTYVPNVVMWINESSNQSNTKSTGGFWKNLFFK